ncbi:hypothetical protein GCM10023191_069780 [Actinoallomurus oryzae]|uniref:Site-specific DNA-methyltransferase (adenine-specific) n=1 Tax=Actinoallomurus oryzae TaxID=502180 RepID=A0ABP8QRN3_9ACTN
MRDEQGNADRLLSRNEFARLAGVKRPTITKWARLQGFPKVLHLADGEYFTLASVLEWLDRRPIPAKNRAADEPADATYGRRARRRSVHAPETPARRTTRTGAGSSDLAHDHLLGPLAESVRGGAGSQADYLSLLLCLIFVRVTARDEWMRLMEVTETDSDRIRPDGLVRHVSERVDQVLRSRGVPSGVYSVLERLRPRAAEDLIEVIRACDQLGDDDFDALLSRFSTERRLGSADYFTPAEVARLMAGLVIAEDAEGGTVYDPYLRGGELLRAASRTRQVQTVGGESPNRETLRLAGMNLAVHGLTARLRPGRDTPWDEPDEHRSPADAVLLNPPFNRQRPMARRRSDSEWPFGPPPRHNDNYAWVQHAVSSLTSGGRAAVLMTSQAGVSSDEEERRIRKEMVEKGAIEAVVALPAHIFPLSDAAVMLWVVRRPAPGPRRILFVDARAMSGKDQAGPVLSREAVESIPELFTDRLRLPEGERIELAGGGSATVAGADALRDTGHSLHPSDYLKGTRGAARSMRSEDTAVSLAELADIRSRVSTADSRVEELRTLPLTRASSGLPSGWRRLALEDICLIQAGPSYSRLGTDDRTKDGPVPVVMPRHLRDRRIVATGAECVSEELARKLAKFRLSPYDILCVRSGAMTEPALVETNQDGWLFGANLFRLRRIGAETVDPWYLLGFLSLATVREWIEDRSTGTAVPFITGQTLGRLMVSIPPIDEQRGIGASLRALDDQIAAHRNFARASEQARATLAEQLMEGVVTLP